MGCQGGRPGIACIANKWIMKHLLVGAILLRIVPVTIKEAATTVLFPLSGVFIGISFAWVGNAHNLLQSEEIRRLTGNHKGGQRHYIFVYQTSVLVIISTLIAWGLSGLGAIDHIFPVTRYPYCYVIVTWLLYSMLSLTISECWSIVFSTQLMLLYQTKIRHLQETRDTELERAAPLGEAGITQEEAQSTKRRTVARH
jgi:hypothetical protein